MSMMRAIQKTLFLGESALAALIHETNPTEKS